MKPFSPFPAAKTIRLSYSAPVDFYVLTLIGSSPDGGPLFHLVIPCGPDPATVVNLLEANAVRHFDIAEDLAENGMAYERFRKAAVAKGVA